MADVDLFVVQQHSVDSLDGGISGLGGFVVDETVTLGATVLVGGNLAGQDIAEGSERIVKGLRLEVSDGTCITSLNQHIPCCRFARQGS